MDIEMILTELNTINQQYKDRLQAYRNAKEQAYHLSGIRYDSPRVIGGKKKDFTDTIVKADDIAQQLKDIRAAMFTLENKLLPFVEMLPPNHKAVIELRYFSGGDKWDNVANVLGYSKGQILKQHHKALSLLRSMAAT